MEKEKKTSWRSKLYEIIFEADTFEGKLFDVLLLIAITISVVVVLLESVDSIGLRFGKEFLIIEWVLTILFTIEYILRIISAKNARRYVFSFYGIIDLLAIIPTYLTFFFPGAQSLIILRAFRLFRVFRIFKMVRFIREAQMLAMALLASFRKILVFLFIVLITVIILASVMYLVEGKHNGFESIPLSIYWGIVTLTTVGYGDITPVTALGKFIANVTMIIGYAIIAVPTGIVTVEMARTRTIQVSRNTCKSCNAKGHDVNAEFCKYCGSKLK